MFQRKLFHSLFSTQKTIHPIIKHINSYPGELQKKDNELLNVYPDTSIKQIYESYVKHCNLQLHNNFIQENIYKQNKLGLRDAEQKIIGIKEAYMRILKDRLKNEIKLNEQKDYEYLLSINFGLEFEKKEMRTEMIVNLSFNRQQIFIFQVDEYKSSQTIWIYPRAVLLATFIITGIPSFFFSK